MALGTLGAIGQMAAGNAQTDMLTALKAVQDWLETLPNASGIEGFPKDAIDAAVLNGLVEQKASER